MRRLAQDSQQVLPQPVELKLLKIRGGSHMVKIISLMHFVNALLVGIFIFLHHQGDNHSRLIFDDFSLLLICLFSIKNFFALIIAEKNRSPLIILLIYFNIIYINLRFVTFQIYGYSDVLFRFPFDSADANYSLIYMFFANIALIFGFLKFRKFNYLTGNFFQPDRLVSQGFLKFLLMAIVTFITLRFLVNSAGTVPESYFTSLLGFLFNPNYFFPLVLFVILYSSGGNKILIFICLFFLYCFNEFLSIKSGARGSLIYLMESIFIFALTLRLRGISVQSFLYLTALFILGAFISFAIFYFSSHYRQNIGEIDALDFARILFSNSSLFNNEFDLLLSRAFSRVGFFDMNAEIIAHSNQYADIFSLQNYFKSFVDNVISPGFDIFDMPKISRSLIFVHENLNNGIPSKVFLESNNIKHSDQIGMYGELYSLLSWLSLFVFFVVGRAFALLYDIKFSRYVAINHYKNFVVLYIFSRFIYSFGIDWLIIESTPLLMLLFLLKFFFGGRIEGRSAYDRENVSSAKW